jgi:hypothetical protein
MRIRSFTSIAIFSLALGLTGCRVQSVLVMPSLAPYSYAAAGQTLEWLPYDPKTTVYVVFDSPSPCAEQSYPIGPKPARCKVLKDHNGYFTYHFSTEKPLPSPPPPPPPPPGHKTILLARSCPYCVVAVDPPPSGSAVAGPGVKGPDTGTGYNLNVSCQSGVAVVDSTLVQGGVQDNDMISWVPIYPSGQVTVTTHNNMCTGGTNGVFNVGQACTVYGPPKTSGLPPVTYPYEVKLDKCDGQGSSSLTINAPPPTTPPPAQ